MTRRWIEQRTDDGSFTLAHPVHGETYHSTSGAWTQARERYAGGCRLRERALELAADGRRALRLLDIGTGLGLNLAAALEALDGTGVLLEATSLERDAELLAHAAASARDPASLERWHAPVRTALRAALAETSKAALEPAALEPGALEPGTLEPGTLQLGALQLGTLELGTLEVGTLEVGTLEVGTLDMGTLELGAGRLRLLVGDASSALTRLPASERFDAVFLDPFSPRVEPDLWSAPFLARIAERMAPGSVLSTYSAATAVRAVLHAAGLRVGRGARVGHKREGTLASPDRDLPPLEPRVRRRLESRASGGSAHARFAPPAGDPRDRIP
jgi:chorismate dehydratase